MLHIDGTTSASLIPSSLKTNPLQIFSLNMEQSWSESCYNSLFFSHKRSDFWSSCSSHHQADLDYPRNCIYQLHCWKIIHSLRESVRKMPKGMLSVSDYCRKFKGFYDKLSTIGQHVDEIDKLHWSLCSLWATFETFTTAIWTSKPSLLFRDLLSQA